MKHSTIKLLLSYVIYFCLTRLIFAKSFSRCKPNTLAIYQVTFEGNWKKSLFPKQYPEWRPPAQWSKTLGKDL